MILFTNLRIFDGSGAPPFPGEVLIDGRHIRHVAQGSGQLPRDGATVIDGGGRTLLPGLVEAHAHLTWPASVEYVPASVDLTIEAHVLLAAQNARITLDHGFTSAYSAGSLGAGIEPALRDAIDRGGLAGPRLRASAMEKGVDGVKGVPDCHDPAHDRSVAGLADYVRARKAEGCDTIKFLLSGDEGFAPGGSQQLNYSRAEVEAVGKAAREAGIWLACHAQAAEAIKRAVRAGFRVFFHCTHADEEALDLLEAHRDQLFVAPALGLLHARIHEARAFGIGPAEARRMGAVSGLEALQRLVPEMRRRGIRVLPGGDYGYGYNPIGRNARDLSLFVDLLGYTPAEALAAATALGGQLMGMDVGLVQDGMLADLLLVDGDPLADLRLLEDASRLHAIMKDGRFHKPPVWLPPYRTI